MYCTYDIQTAPFHLYETQQYGNKIWISRPNEVILDEYYARMTRKAFGASDVNNKSSQKTMHLTNNCFIPFCFHTNYWYRWIAVSTGSASAVSVIRSWLRPEKNLEN
jgi:hypothetical protein